MIFKCEVYIIHPHISQTKMGTTLRSIIETRHIIRIRSEFFCEISTNDFLSKEIRYSVTQPVSYRQFNKSKKSAEWPSALKWRFAESFLRFLCMITRFSSFIRDGRLSLSSQAPLSSTTGLYLYNINAFE